MQLLRMENEALQSQCLNRDCPDTRTKTHVTSRFSLLPSIFSDDKMLSDSTLPTQVNSGLTGFGKSYCNFLHVVFVNFTGCHSCYFHSQPRDMHDCKKFMLYFENLMTFFAAGFTLRFLRSAFSLVQMLVFSALPRIQQSDFRYQAAAYHPHTTDGNVPHFPFYC